MNIILANYRYYLSGGPETYLFGITRLLEERGHTVIPYSVRSPLNRETPYARYFPHGKSDAGDAYLDSVRKSPGNVARLLSCAFFNREAYRNLRRLINDTSPDVVYVLQQVNALSPSVFKAAHDAGVHLVHRLSDFNMMCPRFDCLCDGEPCTSCIQGDYSKASSRRCFHGSRAATEVRIASMRFHRARGYFSYVDDFVCPSSFTASLLERSGTPREKIHVIPTFAPACGKGGGLSDGDPYALYLGRLSPEKGVHLLIEALRDHPSVRLKIAGAIRDAYARSLVRMVVEAGMSDRIMFLGLVEGDDKERLIEGSVCLVCPSVWYENTPNTVLEAYAHGKPVIAFDIGCMPEMIEDGVTGTVVPLRDLDALGFAVERYLADPRYALTLGENARQTARQRYSAEQHLDRLLEILGADIRQEA